MTPLAKGAVQLSLDAQEPELKDSVLIVCLLRTHQGQGEAQGSGPRHVFYTTRSVLSVGAFPCHKVRTCQTWSDKGFIDAYSVMNDDGFSSKRLRKYHGAYCMPPAGPSWK